MPVAIFDMDGVLYRGNDVLPYARETLSRLRAAGWQVFFATNNSTASRSEYVARLERLGLGGDLEHVVTSAYAAAHYLERLEPKPADVFVVVSCESEQPIQGFWSSRCFAHLAQSPGSSMAYSRVLVSE